MKHRKTWFTLIELVVVIVVVGLLSAVVIPNIGSQQKMAERSAIESNINSLQTSSDLYAMDEDGRFPAKESPILGKPEPLDFDSLYPSYIRGLPKVKGIKHWIDVDGGVSSSRADAPSNVSFEGDTLSWSPAEGAVSYEVVLYDPDTVAGNVSRPTYRLIRTVTENRASGLADLKEGQEYLVRSIDSLGLKTPLTNRLYTGYENQAPVATLILTPSEDLMDDTNIVWDYSFLDPDGDSIDAVEWTLDGTVRRPMPTTLSEGSHHVSLRIMDSRGLWSQPVEKVVVVASSPKVVSGTLFTFTNANRSGRFGPSQSSLDAAYKGTTLEGAVTSQSGIQLWTVPVSGRYRIEAKGARGGDYNSVIGGRGAIMSGEFNLSETQTLKLIVGQTGESGMGSGGGGGSFVLTTNTSPLIIAGGGGGAGVITNTSISNASISYSGKTGDGAAPGAGGTNGQGGKGAINVGNSGGAGLYSNGTKGTYSSQPGFSPTNGANGGYGASSLNREVGAGGFGGGGGANNGGHAGGGGGYSGGGSSGNGGTGSGGGAGSYNVGTNQANSIGNSGHGRITFTYLGK